MKRCALPLILLPWLPLMAQTVCAPTPAYSPCDIIFDLTDEEMAAHPKPYTSVTLEAEFRSPHFHTYLMPAFWDGGRRMVVRFTPTEAGQWLFRVSSNIARFDGKQGKRLRHGLRFPRIHHAPQCSPLVVHGGQQAAPVDGRHLLPVRFP